MGGRDGTGDTPRRGAASNGFDPPVTRHAVARGRVTMLPETTAGVAANSLKKGDVLSTARYAGVQATKEVSSLVARAGAVSLPEVTIRFEVKEPWSTSRPG